MNMINNMLGSIMAFVSLNALIAGILFLIDPSGVKMGLTTQMLSKTPFTSYFIPAIILITINGLGCLSVSVLAFKKHLYSGMAGIIMGLVLCGWIHFQMIWIVYSWLQTAIFMLGCLSIFLGMLLIDKTNTFAKLLK